MTGTTAPEPKTAPAFAFLKRRGFQVLTLFLLIHSAVFYSLGKTEAVAAVRPLSDIPAQMGRWTQLAEYPIDPEVLAVLRADDTVNRTYGAGGASAASLFVAFFKSQQTGQSPHSPKHCMPGSGWSPTESGFLEISLDERPDPIQVNRYLIARGEQKSLVLYWYQSHGRVVASEYWSKFYLVLDSIRHRRSDVAMVRVIVPVDSDEATAERTAVDFVKASFSQIGKFLPS
jgi:EpsI family protein